ncbi:MAG: type I-U CRISPR-associated helicase/endonuclease Cas3 [Fuerstiella sp.]
MNLTPDDFPEFFNAVHGYDPFPWQSDLAAKVCSPDHKTGRHWPTCLALPTGSGKTSGIDIAIFALACQSRVPDRERTAPRRIIFVVDRRVIVDEAFEHALILATALRGAQGGILLEVADRLRQLAGGETLRRLLPRQMLSTQGELLPVTCHQLRGGVYRDNAWARTPLQPCVIASTVDQIGSRLLFRGYGCSFKSWPLHAGLAATDSLILLDEAHCAQPFMETLQSIQHFRGRAQEQVGGPFQFAIMSATPPEGTGNTAVHRISAADLEHPVLGKRIRTSKPVRLTPSKAKGASALKDLAVDMVKHAASLIDDQHQAIAILVNRVRTAKYCHMLLDAVRKPDVKDVGPYTTTVLNGLRKLLSEDFDVVLMTGRMRPIDQAKVSGDWLQRLNANSAKERTLERPVVVVATQCLEVGANLDFDAMVSESASLDALRQRFGRLNRTARDISACGIITIRADQISVKNDDPIYGTTLAHTWELLTDKSNDESIDFAIEPMEAVWDSLSADERRSVIPESKHAPVMLPRHLDVLCQTSPAPVPSPAPAVFLHGLEDGRPEVQVCWRADLCDHIGQARPSVARRLINAVSMTPPTAMECMTVSLTVFRRWLTSKSRADAREATSEIADTSTGSSETEIDRWIPQHAAVIWRGKDSCVIGEAPNHQIKPLIVPLKELRPGDTVVLPVSAGGYDIFGHVPDEGQSIDVADECFFASKQRASIRLHPALLDGIEREFLSQTDIDGTRDAAPIIRAFEQLRAILHTMEEEPDKHVVKDLLRSTGDALCESHWLRRAILESSPFEKWTLLEAIHITEEGVFRPTWQMGFRGTKLVPDPNTDLELTRGDSFTGDDEIDSNTVPITLAAHTEGVREFAEVFAANAGIPGLVNAYLRAAEWHDLGKTDCRFQAFLFSGDKLRASLNSAMPMAKSAGLNDVQAEYSRALSGSEMPIGFRHELLSLQVVTELQLLADEDPHDDLILHLLATHHGYSRPFAPVVIDSEPQPLDLSWNGAVSAKLPVGNVISSEKREQWISPHRIDSGIAERFWRLVNRYGWWGLAWLESVFVLADRRRSEAEQYLFAADFESTETAQQELTL